MRKRYLVSAVGLLGASVVATYFIKNKSNSSSKEASTLDQAGVPDQIANQDITQLENAKMVSEGSQFGVQYYSHHKENERND